GFTAQYYCVEATVDGVTGRIAMEKSGDHLVIWPSFFAIGGISAAPAQSFVIAEGAVLEPVDPNTTGWGVAIDGPQFALTAEFSAVNNNGVWTEQAIEEEKPTVTLGYMNAGADGTWELTVDDISGFTAQYYCVEATVDGVTGRIAMEKSGDHLVIWPSFFAIGGISAAPAQSFVIAEGAVLEPVDPNTTGWGVAIDGPQFAVATAFSFTNYNGTWSDKPIVEPIDVELTFDNVNTTNDWAFTYATNGELPAAGQWYTTTATVDGVERAVLVEYFAPASLFYIYNHCFAATPGGAAYPAASLMLAEGAILTPISTPDASAVIVGGQTLKLTKEIDVAYENGAWKDKNDIVPIDVELTFNNINTTNDWAFSANANALPTANQWFAVPVKLDGTDRTVLMEYDVNASWFYVYHHCFWPTPNDNSVLLPQSSLFIPAGTVMTPITTPDASAVNKKGQTYKLTADVDMAFENGAWVDKNVLPPVTPLDMELTFATVNSKNDWAFTGVADGIPTVNQWYTTTATVDGNDVTVLMEYDVNSTYFYIYYHCFSATPGTEAYPRASLQLAAGAILTPISAPDASAVIVGGQTYRLTAAVNVALEDGVWTDQNAAPPVVITPLDTVLTFANVNQNNDWAFTGVVSGELPTANQWYMASVKLDGTDRIVLMEYDVNSSLFYVYHHCFWNVPNADPALLPQSSLTIPADTLLVPVFTPDATAVIKGGQTLKLTKAVNVVLSEGDWIDDDLPKPVYNDLTVDKIAVSMSADQPASLRSYLLLSVVDPLPQAGAEWWNNYDMFNLTVLVDGTPYKAAIGGGGDASTLALYLMWTAVDEQVLANANEIVIKAGSKGRVGLEGITFASDLRIYKENGSWKTDYNPAEDVDLSNAVSVGVAFDHIDGANRLYLSALMSDSSKIMDTYGDWTTVFGGIRMGILNADGTYTWVEESNMPWSVTGTYFYMSSLQLHLYDAVEIKKGTVLVPDASCKSQNPIVIANDFRMVRDEWEEWVVDGEFTDKPDYSTKPGVPGSSDTGDNTKSPIAWIIVGICALALVLCLVLSGKKSRRQ
ncbi:MAG: hypothetical protein IJ465_00375, partial [Clostridia bacterium]|nr:hypothetical protein [Clostridia bacterium]